MPHKLQLKDNLRIASVDKEEMLRELADKLRCEVDTLQILDYGQDPGSYVNVLTKEGEEQEWTIVEDEDVAEKMAETKVRQDLEENPNYFNQDWLSFYIDEDSYINDVRSDIENMVEESPESYASFIDDEEPAEGESYSEDQKERMVEGKLDDIRGNLLGWFNDMGYEGDSLSEQISSYLDIEEAIAGALQADGYAHFLNSYDGSTSETKSGYVYWRTN